MKKNEVSKKIMNDVVVFTKEQRDDYKSLCRQIMASMKSLETGYIKLALALSKVDSDKLFEIEGYKNVYEFAKDRYNISKSTCYNYLGLVSAFGLTADSKPLYTSTQMIAMLPAVRSGVDVQSIVTPDMSVSEIKKALKVAVPDRVSPAPKSEKARSKREVLLSFACEEEYQAQFDGMLSLILHALEDGKTVQVVAL